MIAALYWWLERYNVKVWEDWRTITVWKLVVLTSVLFLAALFGKLLAIGGHYVHFLIQVRRMKDLVEDSVPVMRRKNTESMRAALGVKRILIVHASVGAGHKRAAEAIEAQVKLDQPDAEVKVVDIMAPPLADRTLIYFYKDWYLSLVGGDSWLFGTMGPMVVGNAFENTNKIQDAVTGGGFTSRHLTQGLVLNFMELVLQFAPDVVVHTHFLAPQLLASLRRKHGYRMPHVTVVTDYDLHSWWFQQPTDHYFVPTALTKHQLVSAGVPPDDVTISGIPVMPMFNATLEEVDNCDTIEQRVVRFKSKMDAPVADGVFELTPEGARRPLIVQMSTGKSALQIYANLLKLETPASIVVVCGRQADVRGDLERLPVPPRHRVSLLGYTRTMHELLAIADVIVSKPGGLITSESLACGLMMVIVDQYPGQEERNKAMLLEEGAGVAIWDYGLLQPKLDSVFRAPEGARNSLAEYKRNAKRISAPDAAFAVSDFVLAGKARLRMNQDQDASMMSVGSLNGNISERSPGSVGTRPKNGSHNSVSTPTPDVELGDLQKTPLVSAQAKSTSDGD